MQNRCKKKACKKYCRRGASPPHPLDTSRWKQIDQRQEIGRHWRHWRRKRQKACQNDQNITKMASKIDPKSIKNRGCVFGTFLKRLWAAKGGVRHLCWAHFRDNFPPKIQMEIEFRIQYNYNLNNCFDCRCWLSIYRSVCTSVRKSTSSLGLRRITN